MTAAVSEEETCDLVACQASAWHSTFKSFCFPTRFVPLPRSAVEYLESDGISAEDLPSAVPPLVEGSDSTHEGHSEQDDEESAIQAHDLEPLKSQIATAIEELGGQVMPKLNWSAPVDATWISPDGLRCTNPDEVLLLLKCSERAAHDLHYILSPTGTADVAQPPTVPPEDFCSSIQPELVLKQFRTLDHSMEFRGFVLEHKLVGISQRDPTQHFPAIHDRLQDILSIIHSFYCEHVADKFDRPNCAIPLDPTCQFSHSASFLTAPHMLLVETALDADAFDVYLTKKLKVKLLDINPAYGTTQALLFAWDELRDVARDLQESTQNGSCNGTKSVSQGPCHEGCELRTVHNPAHIQTSAKSIFGAPSDTLDMPGLSWPGVIDALREQCKLQVHDEETE